MTNDEKAIEEGCFYDASEADKACRFIETYYVPSTTGKPVKLLDWQRAFISKLYGWKRKTSTGTVPRFTRAILSTAKKSGKNLIASAVCLKELYNSTVPSGLVVSASTSRDNATQIYREIAYSVRQNKKLTDITKLLDSQKEAKVAKLNSRYKAFSADSGSAEGENISCLVVDELHAHRSEDLFRSLEYSTISRRQQGSGLLLIISTSGADQSTLWYDLFQYANQVQQDKLIDTALLPAIYTIPLEADLDNSENWALANPSLGTAFSKEDFARDYYQAKQSGTAALLSFRRYRANQWVVDQDCYLDPAIYDRSVAVIPDEQLRTAPLFCSADLSQTTDPCSVACCWVLPDRKFHIRVHSWVCEEGVKKREDKANLPQYKVWGQEGVLTITKGTANDYRRIKGHLLKLREQFNLKEIVFDQFNALEMCAELQGENITVYRQPQNHKAYNGPCKELELAIREGRVSFAPNKMLRWAFQNTKLDLDQWENCKPSRDKSTDKIDPVIVTVMSFGKALLQPTQGQRKTAYEDRGITIIG